jgi:hypothetical protein
MHLLCIRAVREQRLPHGVGVLCRSPDVVGAAVAVTLAVLCRPDGRLDRACARVSSPLSTDASDYVTRDHIPPGTVKNVGARVGACVGSAVVGAVLGKAVGALEGRAVVGTELGTVDGVAVGRAVVGERVGDGVTGRYLLRASKAKWRPCQSCLQHAAHPHSLTL